MTAAAAVDVTARLCDFLRADAALPEEVLHAGRRTIANAMGLAAGASGHPAVGIALDTAGALDLPGHGGVLGRSERLSLEWAALVNGLAAHVEDFDDTHLETVIHPGAAVVPAALAMGEWTDASGEDLLRATVLGVEVALRVGQGLSPAHFDRGWHITGTCGHIGAAAAAGRLLGLDAPRLAVAVSLAATQASGLLAALGTMTKPLHAGRAAANGVEAALLAEGGFTAPAQGIEGRRGFARLASADPDFEVMVGDLGRRWEVLQNTFKPYACGIVAHPVVDAAIELRRAAGGDDLRRVSARVNPVVLDVMGVAEPRDGLQSKFSVYHAVAVGIADGMAGPAQFTTARALDPAVRALRERVSVELDPGVRRDEAYLLAETGSGDVHEVHVPHASGSARRPMTDPQLRDKVVAVAAGVLGPERASALWDTVMRLGAPPCRELVAAARPA